MKLESNYIRAEALGASGICDQIRASGNYRWTAEGKCQNISTGKLYSGDQKLSNCACLGPPPAQGGGAAVLEFFKTTLLGRGSGLPGTVQRGAPTTTASSLVLPAVLVVGGVGLLLVLRKKKK